MTEHLPWRKTSQPLAPANWSPPQAGSYSLYPSFPLSSGQIERGFEALARRLASHTIVTLDGYGGVFWEQFRANLDAALSRIGVRPRWCSVATALRAEHEIDALVAPFLGGDDPIFGSRYTGKLEDFFDPSKLKDLKPSTDAGLTILYGTGAALAGWHGLLCYVEVPKNEIQFRSRASSITNLGVNQAGDPKAAYKRFYFVDWVALNQHKAHLLSQIDLIIDEQRPDDITFISGSDCRAALDRMSRGYFRARPWFEPGPWGGQWIKAHIPQLPQQVPNYAWSFELISPENGIAFESDGLLLEVSFDFLMFHAYQSVLGDSAERFKYEFPIRFDFLDTYNGGNLSVQCHPRPSYIREHFGERFTQDETYYILDCMPDAQVYLGFKDDIDPAQFRVALEQSYHDAQPIDVESFVHVESAQRGDLFLIPNGTIHCSGVNNLILEISATPYIFTFKMYDWMRLDLEGNPRPLNIDRAFANLYFDRKGEQIGAELIAHPVVIAQGEHWKLIHLPTHAEHFYDVHRLEFSGSVEVTTDGSVHVLSLVEGSRVLLETKSGEAQWFSFAETFVVPAAAHRYRLTSEPEALIKIIKSFVKP